MSRCCRRIREAKPIYLSFSKPGTTDAKATTTLIRGRFDGTALTGVEQVFEAVTEGANHFGGKIAFDRNGFVFLTLGDRQVPPEGKTRSASRAGPLESSRQGDPAA